MARQTDTLDRLGPGSCVAIIRLRSLGDCVLCTPALALLKAARPDLRIGVVVESRFAQIFEGHPAVDEVIAPEIRALRAFGPDLCVNLHGGSRSARLTALSGARYRAGFHIFKPSLIYNVAIPTAQTVLGIERRVHTAEHMAAAVFYLGVPVGEIPRACVPFTDVKRGQPYAVIHPVAALPEKTWPAERFVDIAGHLNVQPVFIGAAGDDLTAFQQWPVVAGASLREIAGLMRGASLFIGNDSGPAHMAAAFGVPQVVLFGPSDAEIWSPWKTASRVLQAEPIAGISVKSVGEAVEELR